MKGVFLKAMKANAVLFLDQANKLSFIHANDLMLYGEHYRDSIQYNTTELRIKWLEFKATFLIEVFRLKNINES